MRIDHLIEIAAPRSRVWETTIDVESWPDLTPTITDVVRLEDGPLEVGSRVRIKQPASRARVWTVDDLRPGERFAWSTRAMGCSMRASHDLVETADGTTNILAVELAGPLAGVVGRLIRRPVARALATENEGFKRVCETTAPAGRHRQAGTEAQG